MISGLTNESRVSVAAFPIAWRIEMVNEGNHRGQDYVRYNLTRLGWFGVIYIDIVAAFSGERPT